MKSTKLSLTKCSLVISSVAVMALTGCTPTEKGAAIGAAGGAAVGAAVDGGRGAVIGGAGGAVAGAMIGTSRENQGHHRRHHY